MGAHDGMPDAMMVAHDGCRMPWMPGDECHDAGLMNCLYDKI